MKGRTMRTICTCLACMVVAAGAASQQASSAPGEATTGAPLIRVGHLVGDEYAGFSNACLAVYEDGRYHREASRQIRNRGGRPTPTWGEAKVFEGTLSTQELDQLKRIVGAEGFRAISGTLGNFDPISLLIWRNGVTPRGDIEVLEATVMRAEGLQVFHVIGPAPRERADALGALQKWVAGVSKFSAVAIPDAIASACDVPEAHQGRIRLYSGPKNRLRPVPLETPGPACAVDKGIAAHAAGVAIRASVNPDGDVVSVAVRHSVNPKLDQCAADAVKRWKFLPASLGGVAVPMSTDVEVEFTRVNKPD